MDPRKRHSNPGRGNTGRSTRGERFADYAPVAVSRSSAEGVGIVRLALPGDLGSIVRLQRAVGRAVSPPAAIEAAISDPARLVVVGEIDGCVAGWAKTHFWRRSDGDAPAGHYLGGVTVDPVFRRRGLGAALTEARLEWIWQRTSHAWYIVNAQNRASIALHERWDFEEVARGERFHATTFTGGVGVLLRAQHG